MRATKRFGMAWMFVAAFAGCEGRVEERSILDDPREPRVDWWPRTTPSSCRISTAEEILSSGIARVSVEHGLVRVRYYDEACYRIEQTRFFVGPTLLARSLLFPFYVVFLVPLDLIAGLNPHIGFVFFRSIFVMDSEWVPAGEYRTVKDVTITDWDEGERTEPMPDVPCELVVTAGQGGACPAKPLRVFRATTGPDGTCSFDLRQLAGEVEEQRSGWTLEYQLNSNTIVPIRRSLSFTAEQVTRIANLK